VSGLHRASLLGLIVALIACRGSTTSSPIVTRVELIAPRTLAPGTTAQLKLFEVRSDGSTQDVTATALFRSRFDEILAVSSGGTVTALKLGESVVSGQISTHSSSREVVVVPDGTFRVVGQVIEEGTSGLPVGGVRMEADGAQPATTDFEGRYRLYGALANARMRAAKIGYVTKEFALALSDHTTQNVALAVAESRVDAAGVYQLTLEAASECRDQLPEGLLKRQYTAAISQIGSEILVRLTGSRFVTRQPYGGDVVDSTAVPGRFDQTGLVLTLIWPSSCEAGEGDTRILEAIGDTTVYEMYGTARLSPTGANFTGTLSGEFAAHENRHCGLATNIVGCRSASHRVTLTR
jgi:hypothetical protein